MDAGIAEHGRLTVRVAKCDEALTQQATRKIPVHVAHHASDKVVPAEYSADLLAVLKAGGHPTQALDQYDPPGTNGHSIDVKIVPQVWQWLAGFSVPQP